MQIIKTEREGFALAAAVMAMVVIGAIVTGGFYAASQEDKVSTGATHAADAFYVAEQGVIETVGFFTRPELQGMGGNGVLAHEGELELRAGLTGAYDAEVRRLGSTHTFLVTSNGRVQANGRDIGAARRAGMLVRVRNVNIRPRASVLVGGSLNVTGNARIDGTDAVPANWPDCVQDTTRAGVIIKHIDNLDQGGSSTITGDPPTLEDPTIDDSDFTEFGDFSYADLTSMATRTFGAGTTINGARSSLDALGDCNTGDPNNWGEPVTFPHACNDFFPIIWARGDIKLAGGSVGQGILLVEGNLELTGGSTFYGIVIVLGTLKSTGTGGHVNGMTLVKSGAELDDDSFQAGNSTLQYSSCAANRAQQFMPSLQYAQPVSSRYWIDLTAAGVGN